jgi:hypothetical protein
MEEEQIYLKDVPVYCDCTKKTYVYRNLRNHYKSKHHIKYLIDNVDNNVVIYCLPETVREGIYTSHKYISDQKKLKTFEILQDLKEIYPGKIIII